jgi:hypothetical protein
LPAAAAVIAIKIDVTKNKRTWKRWIPRMIAYIANLS